MRARARELSVNARIKRSRAQTAKPNPRAATKIWTWLTEERLVAPMVEQARINKFAACPPGWKRAPKTPGTEHGFRMVRIVPEPKKTNVRHAYDFKQEVKRHQTKFAKNQEIAASVKKFERALRKDVASLLGRSGRLKKHLTRQDLSVIAASVIHDTRLRIGGNNGNETKHFGVLDWNKKVLKDFRNKNGRCEVFLEFVGKSGKQVSRWFSVEASTYRVLRALSARTKPNAKLFSTEEGRLRPTDVNEYLHRWGLTAKMFRTFDANEGVFRTLEKNRKAPLAELAVIGRTAIRDGAARLTHGSGTFRRHYLDNQRIFDFFKDRWKPQGS